MTLKHAALAAATAAVLAAPAFAQTTDCRISSSNLASDCSTTTTLGAGPATMSGSTVTNSSGTSVSSGTGVTVTPGAPSTSVTVMPSTSVAVSTTHLLPGGANVPANSTTVLGGPAGNASGSQSVVTTYWTNVPADAMNRWDFQRWTHLRP